MHESQDSGRQLMAPARRPGASWPCSGRPLMFTVLAPSRLLDHTLLPAQRPFPLAVSEKLFAPITPHPAPHFSSYTALVPSLFKIIFIYLVPYLTLPLTPTHRPKDKRQGRCGVFPSTRQSLACRSCPIRICCRNKLVSFQAQVPYPASSER